MNAFFRDLYAIVLKRIALGIAGFFQRGAIGTYSFLFRSQLEKELWAEHRGIAKQVRRRINRNGLFKQKEAIGAVMQHSGILDALFPDDSKKHCVWIESGTACAEFARFIDRSFVNGDEPRSCEVTVRTNNFVILLLLVPRPNFVVELLGGKHYDRRYMATFRDNDSVLKAHINGCSAVFMTSSGTALLSLGPNSLQKNAVFKRKVVETAIEKDIPVFLLNDITKIETRQRREDCHPAFPNGMHGLLERIAEGKTCWVVYSHKRIEHPDFLTFLSTINSSPNGAAIKVIPLSRTSGFGYFIVADTFKFFDGIARIS